LFESRDEVLSEYRSLSRLSFAAIFRRGEYERDRDRSERERERIWRDLRDLDLERDRCEGLYSFRLEGLRDCLRDVLDELGGLYLVTGFATSSRFKFSGFEGPLILNESFGFCAACCTAFEFEFWNIDIFGGGGGLSDASLFNIGIEPKWGMHIE